MIGASAAPTATPAGGGSISGTISLSTGASNGVAFVPASSVIEVTVGSLSGNPNAPHLTIDKIVDFAVPPEQKSVSFTVTGLDFAVPWELQADVHALNRGPHFWSGGLTRVDKNKDSPVTLSAQHSRATSIEFSAAGVVVPATATADGVTPLGSVGGMIVMNRCGSAPLPDALPAGTQVVAYAASDEAAASPIGTSTLAKITSYDGQRGTAYFALSGLPIDTPLVLRVVSTAGPPAAVYLYSVYTYPHQVLPEGMRLAGSAWHVTLSLANRDWTLPAVFSARVRSTVICAVPIGGPINVSRGSTRSSVNV